MPDLFCDRAMYYYQTAGTVLYLNERPAGKSVSMQHPSALGLKGGGGRPDASPPQPRPL